MTESCSPVGRSATRSRIGSGRVSWRRRLCARLGEMPRSAHTASDAVVVWQAGAGVPAVGELLLLVDEAELLALVGLGLDAPDLVGRGLVVEQQDDQGADRREAFEAVGAGELVAGLGGEQTALSVVEEHGRLVGVGAVADARDQLAGAHQQPGERAGCCRG